MQACVRVCHINVCAYVFLILCVYMWWGNTKHAVPDYRNQPLLLNTHEYYRLPLLDSSWVVLDTVSQVSIPRKKCMT